MPGDIDPKSLAGAWTHSHEEDHDEIQVFRRSGYAFPRSRGRTSYELRSDGTLGGSRPGPDDRTVATSGSWDVQNGKLNVAPEGSPPIQYQIESVDSDRMVVKRITSQ